jgi:hypothetical protein
MALQGFRRTLAALACVIVGAASFALSFVALRDVAVELDAVPASLGWLVPIVIDGGVICGSAVIWSLSREQIRRPVFPFLFVATLVLVSVVVNAAHAGPAPLAKLIASLPPLILLGTLELVAAQGRRLSATERANEVAVTHVAPPAAAVQPAQAVRPSSPLPHQAEGASQAPKAPVAVSGALPTSLAGTTNSPSYGEAVSELEAAVEEVFEPAAWIDPTEDLDLPDAGYSRPANTRRRATRVRAQQPLN